MSTKIDTIAKKISIGSLNGLRGGFKKESVTAEPMLAARIYGRADSFEAKDGGAMGVSFKFVGDFLGVNQYGEITSSPVCYLIAPADGMLVAALKNNEGKGVEFGFDFMVVKNDTAVLGYEYKVKPILETTAAEPLLAIQSKITAPPIPVKPRQPQLALAASTEAATAQTASTESAEQKTEETAEQKADVAAKGKGKTK